MRRISVGLLISFLVVASLAGCLGQQVIDEPADQLIPTEDDFENNWTSWWTVESMPIENISWIKDRAGVNLTHYPGYPIEQYERDLRAQIVLSVFNSTENATEGFDSAREAHSNYGETIECEIGDEGFYYITGDHNDSGIVGFRENNVIVALVFFGDGDSFDISDPLVSQLLELQESKLR